MGRISKEKDSSGNILRSYTYDSYGQLTRENNAVLDKTFVYEYNNNGGITKVKEYAYTTSSTPTGTATEKAYTYDSTYPDRLTKCGSTSISYNSMGCPTTYNGYTASWTRGKLSKLTKGSIRTGTQTYNYTYNAFGQRIETNYTYMVGTSSSSAVVMGMLTGYNHEFRYDQSGRLICESKVNQYYGEDSGTEKKVYLYDETGIIGMVYTSESGTATTYYFQRNLLGDVIGIYNTSGTKVGGYAYDAWGNCTITLNTNGIATKNPIRYRGYYYDEETKLYYLNARYYCPEWCRFISPNNAKNLDFKSVNGLAQYGFANNDPVSFEYSGSLINKLSTNLNVNVPSLHNVLTLVSKTNASVHWKDEWLSTDRPSFFAFTNSKAALVDWGLSIYKGSLYFDAAEIHSLYVSAGNVSAFAGYNVEKRKYGVFADANVLSVGYDGRYIDAGISVVGVGFILGWEGKKFRFKLDPPGWFGVDISIDFGQIIKDIFGWEW
ncbi:MAG: RHS repeat-associated core domain-containing protein [Clostridia bacterium]|nr:RHS repeat-associated core domain-containing protein [Clostridia bacterium]